MQERRQTETDGQLHGGHRGDHRGAAVDGPGPGDQGGRRFAEAPQGQGKGHAHEEVHGGEDRDGRGDAHAERQVQWVVGRNPPSWLSEDHLPPDVEVTGSVPDEASSRPPDSSVRKPANQPRTSLPPRTSCPPRTIWSC